MRALGLDPGFVYIKGALLDARGGAEASCCHRRDRDEPAAPYMSSEAPELLFLNVAKIVEFTQGGIDGIVNAICFGCMVGNASAAVIEHIRAAHHDIPSSQWSAPAARSPPGS